MPYMCLSNSPESRKIEFVCLFVCFDGLGKRAGSHLRGFPLCFPPNLLNILIGEGLADP